MLKLHTGNNHRSKNESIRDCHNNRALLFQRANHNETLDILQSKVDTMNTEIQELSALPTLTCEQQRRLKSLLERRDLIMGTLQRACKTR